MTNATYENKCDMTPIRAKLEYWLEKDGKGDEYRRTHDLDCILTGGNLNADTIFSLWLPLRYTLNYFDLPRWREWKNFEAKELRPCKRSLKSSTDFLRDIIEHTDHFLPESELTQKLSALFVLGNRRSNVMLLPDRSWNSRRGSRPYWEYLPHFLFDLFNSEDKEALRRWLQEESLEPFFADDTFEQENIRDLAGTGNPCSHNPRIIDIVQLVNNYIDVLQRRDQLLRGIA